VSGDLGCATCLVFSKPRFSGFLSDALNTSDIDDWRCRAFALQLVPSGSTNTYRLAEVSDGQKLWNVHILLSMYEQIRGIVPSCPLQLKEQRPNMGIFMRLRNSVNPNFPSSSFSSKIFLLQGP
jgi:hypothetical protein